MKAWAFSDVLAPVRPEDFFARTLGQRYLHATGDPDKFSSLLSWSDLNRLLCCTGLDLARVHVLSEGRDVPAQEFGRNSLSGFSFLSVTEVNELLAGGAVLTIDAIEDIHEPILDFCRAIERIAGSAGSGADPIKFSRQHWLGDAFV
jgi:bifunctional lysine-specific demethylase and histidyl-hydroxylase MINA